jgi:hypothetical protein
MKKKFKKKLFLNKTTLANLDNEKMASIFGGATDLCLDTRPFFGCGTLARACQTVAVTCGCNTLTDCS